MKPKRAIKVFYDGGCPLCSREIDYYRRMQSIAAIDWIDVSDSQVELDRYGLEIDMAMARFHVLDTAGRWQTGAYGFAEMWRRLPGFRWLAYALVKFRLLPLADRIYSRFARSRLQKRCSDQACT